MEYELDLIVGNWYLMVFVVSDRYELSIDFYSIVW